MTVPLDAPVPGLAAAFVMIPKRGQPVVVGEIATGGRRSHASILGGHFTGEGRVGRLVSGNETLLERRDGIAIVEASYYIAFIDGVVVRCFGTGYRTRGEPFAGTRLALLFEAADDSSAAALATRAFIAEQPEGGAVMTIHRIT